jgi:cobalt/nickel transport system permease protein
MHINTFDHYQSRNSIIHNLDPRIKVVITVLLITSNILLPDGRFIVFGLVFLQLIFLSWLAKLDLSFVIKRSFVALPFTLAAITTVFTLPGQAILHINIGQLKLTATDVGLIHFSSIVLRSWLSVQMAILLTATTEFPDLIHALRHLKVPNILVATISFMYRYLFVLSDEAVRLIRARESRSARESTSGHSGLNILQRARIAGSMGGQLFVRSYERSERVYSAMLARGYNGNFITLNPHEIQANDFLAGLIGLLFLLITQWFGRY